MISKMWMLYPIYFVSITENMDPYLQYWLIMDYKNTDKFNRKSHDGR
jgi:hypothetical protein